MRNISSLYFFLKITPFLIKLIVRTLSKYHAVIHWFYSGTLFFIAAVSVGITKPYKKAYMNYMDSFILSNLALINCILLSEVAILLTIRVLLATPVSVLIIIMVTK